MFEELYIMESMGNLRRTHYSADTLNAKLGEEVTVAGFVARQRDLGNLIFIATLRVSSSLPSATRPHATCSKRQKRYTANIPLSRKALSANARAKPTKSRPATLK